jgi:hypothetical protein
MVLGGQLARFVFCREPSEGCCEMVISEFVCEFCGKRVGCMPICYDCSAKLTEEWRKESLESILNGARGLPLHP